MYRWFKLLGLPAIAAFFMVVGTASAHNGRVAIDCVGTQVVGTYEFDSFPQGSTADLAIWRTSDANRGYKGGDGHGGKKDDTGGSKNGDHGRNDDHGGKKDDHSKSEDTGKKNNTGAGYTVVKTGVATGLGRGTTRTTLTVGNPNDGVTYTYYATATWTADGGGYVKSRTVTCPPVQPTPTPTPTVTPTPTPPPPVVTPTPPALTPTPTPTTTPTPTPPPSTPIGCDGKPLVPGVAAPVCKPDTPRVCPNAGPNRYRITVTPRHSVHGKVTFRLHGPHVRDVRWYVDLKRRDVHNASWERVSGSERRYTTYLWAKGVWGSRLWGSHWITVRAFVGPRGCGHVVHAKLKYFNQDPPTV